MALRSDEIQEFDGILISDNSLTIQQPEEFAIDEDNNVYMYTCSIDYEDIGSTAGEIIEYTASEVDNSAAHSNQSVVCVQLDDGSQVLCQLVDGANLGDKIESLVSPLNDESTVIEENFDEVIQNVNCDQESALDKIDLVAVEDDGDEQTRLIDKSISASAPEDLVCYTQNGKRSYVCQIMGCKRRYTSRNYLKTHQRNHTGERPYTCDHCQAAFNTDYALKVHTRRHTGDKPYACTQEGCGKSFRASGDLNKHGRVHSGVRPFQCTFEGCAMAFTSSTIRKTHMLTHTGDRPFKCSHNGCDKNFRSLTNRNNHERIHSGVKPFVCQICSKSFTEYSSLYKHRHVHSSTILIMACPVCGKTYKKLQSLTVHMTKAHPGDGSSYSKADIVYMVSQEDPDDVADEEITALLSK